MVGSPFVIKNSHLANSFGGCIFDIMAKDKTDANKKKFLEALTDAKGIVMTACAATGLSRSNFYQWCELDADFKAKVDDIQEVAIDFVESKLMEKINGVSMVTGEGDIYQQPPSDTAIIFYLKTKGKKRGYVERTEVEQSGGIKLDWNETKTYASNDKADTGS